MTSLMNVPISQLLDKFGKGVHTPGSGSAAALIAAISAALAQTVTSLTSGKSKYEKHQSKLSEILSELQEEIIPELKELFELDAKCFNEVIELRIQRDKEPDVLNKHVIARSAIEATEEAIEIPFRIIFLCFQVAEYAEFLMKSGFRSARGDSAVAIYGAIAGIRGSLAIIELNLLKCLHEPWATGYLQRLNACEMKLEELEKAAKKVRSPLRTELERNRELRERVLAIQTQGQQLKTPTDTELEQLARDLQNALYVKQKGSRKRYTPKNALDLDKAITSIGFHVARPTSLGDHVTDQRVMSICGVCDRKQKLIAVSKQYDEPIQRFTLAHELGHALLHADQVLHRDIPLDGSREQHGKDPKEREADKFAAYFLMPTKLVVQSFQDRFGMNKLSLDENIAGRLGLGSISQARVDLPDRRAFSRYIAQGSFIDGNSITSMANEYEVSIEAMAIRLEELGLVG